MKVSLEFELIPAVGVLLGYQKGTGIIIMLPFISLTVKRIGKRKKTIANTVKSGVEKFEKKYYTKY